MTTRILAAAFVVALFLCMSVSAQTTAFTYQGSLKDGANPANGSYDFEFKLFDLASGGVQQGSTIQRLNVAVANGIFTVSLDFGAAVLPGADRFLEIGLRVNGNPGGFQQLLPRQAVASSPYAVKSLAADNATNAGTATTANNATQLGGIAADQYVVTTDPRMTDARPPTAGSTNYIQNNDIQQPSSAFNISGNGTVGGTLTGNIVRAETQFNIGSGRVLSAPTGALSIFAGLQSGTNNTGLSNSFFGAGSGQANTSGSSNTFVGTQSGKLNLGGSSNSFLGTSAGSANTTGNSNTFIGSSAGDTNTTGNNNNAFGAFSDVADGSTNATAIGFRALATQSNSLILGSINGVNNANADTDVGIGTTAPTQRLHVVGNGLFTGNLNVTGSISGTVNVGTATGLLAEANGGSGLSSSGAAGSFLRSNGTTWTASQLSSSDVPAGSPNYIRNSTVQQATSNFNISGNGNLGGTLSALTVNAIDGYLIGGNSVLSLPSFESTVVGSHAGENIQSTGQFNTFVGAFAGQTNISGSRNSFLGAGAGPNSTGDFNSFFGNDAGNTNTVGGSNTIIGARADVGTNNLTNATAIGSEAMVSQSNSLVLGSINGVNGAIADTRVGIGTTAPDRELHVRGPGSVEIGIESADVGGIQWTLQSASGANGGRFEIIDRTIGSSRMTILDDGSLGIGTTAPADRLHVNGLIRVTSLGLVGTTSLCRNSLNQISTCSSSLRYKTNIDPFAFGLSFVNQLHPISFDWKDGGMKDVGFGAEDVAKIDPRFVTYNSSGEVEGVKYDRLSVAFVNAFKEQQVQIEKQQALIEQLTKRLEQLEKKDTR